MRRPILAATVAIAALLGVSAAQAGPRWSIGIGIDLPVLVSGVQVVQPAPVYVAPAAPVMYAPPVRYAPYDPYYAPPPTVVYEAYGGGRRWADRDDHERWHREHERRERWEHERGDDGPRRWH